MFHMEKPWLPPFEDIMDRVHASNEDPIEKQQTIQHMFADTTKSQLQRTYCLCGSYYDSSQFMIQCDACKEWFHGNCVDVKEHRAIYIDKYYCPHCEHSFGPSIEKPLVNFHRHDFWDTDADKKPVQAGTVVFTRVLSSRQFSDGAEAVSRMHASRLTEAFLRDTGFDRPLLVDEAAGLDMTMPPDSFDVHHLPAYIGVDREIDVIDSARQVSVKMSVADLIQYYKLRIRNRILNCISLEFSDTPLSDSVEAPRVIRSLDWVNTSWPKDPSDDAFLKRPRVQKYCLIGAKNSYTDFHVDFGGTSVWYHVLRGEKIFYLIRPTASNLIAYQRWATSKTQADSFFADEVDKCYSCVIRKGQTLFIPTGWIHAVLTTVDSIVFGGNFLHSLNISMQLQIYDIEKKLKTPEKFRFPLFETVNWYAAKKLMLDLREYNMKEEKYNSNILSGVKVLLSYLKQWNADKDYNMSSRELIPDTINSHKLLKDLSKEIRHAERFLTASNSPKSERQSKRRKKKLSGKNFVDYDAQLKTQTSHSWPDEMIQSHGSQSIQALHDQPASSQLAEQEGSTILKVMLKDGTPHRIVPSDSTVMRQSSKEYLSSILKESCSQQQTPNKSVYDFHDNSTSGNESSDEFEMVIDDSPRKRFKTSVEMTGSLKMRIPTSLYTKSSNNFARQGERHRDSGIESLLKASAMTNPMDTGRASPSTQEAIAGMLSIGQVHSSQLPVTSSSSPTKKRRRRSPVPDDEIAENISNVHQDDEYIYPSLDNSDDEDYHIFKPRGRTKVDEAWNPTARVGPLLPKMNRPAREGTKKQAVEKVLEAAAAKRASLPDLLDSPTKRSYNRKKVRPNSNRIDSTKTTGRPAIINIKSPSTNDKRPDKGIKGRKGFKTAKQRLGRILKIHKMIH